MEREHILINNDVMRDVDTIGGNVQAFVPFVKGTIPKKNTLFRPKL